uniref:Small ribosomal subunit protein uS11c n=1 Tax=Gloeochaete wittrockiana TaxID=38269 RepID=A0A3G1IW07_9EUKA|nr:ribosomal protein S11 [Gloeochaete wittrockiana]ASQ40234.1 ribosomal protein S11 [Gloeochaete wittrockiana]
MVKKVKKISPRKQKKNISQGRAYIQATFNNTIVTITDLKGDVIAWASAGSSGFKGARKGTPFAAQTAAENCGKFALDQGLTQISIYIKGPGSGRELAIRALRTIGFQILGIRDITGVPHNGCRPSKKRRI